jgi:hypothetical protein
METSSPGIEGNYVEERRLAVILVKLKEQQNN